VANAQILREKIFDKIWIQPAAGDAGGALGAALFVWHQVLTNERRADGMNDSQGGSYLGPAYSNDEIRAYVQTQKIPFTELTDDELPEKIADLIEAGKVIGWFYGRMEFGPRALGARSIIGDARSPEMQELMNLKIKFRESFRPFAPSVLREKASDWFELESESPYMLLVAPVAKNRRRKMTAEQETLFGLEKLLAIRSEIPAVTHVDYSARVQTVTEDHQPMYYRMIKQFAENSGCPVIINTSFNVRGEPIVATPADAFTCFMRTNMDYLLVGNFLLEKKEQKPLEKDVDWLREFELD
jgi:carbamoyltransferase